VSAVQSPTEDTAVATYEIRHHYNVPTDFYRLWLDPTLTYSCALWHEGDALEQAQLRKLDYLIDAARAPGAGRVLDIGCGWGSMLRRLVDHHGVDRADGITVSSSQADSIRARGDDRVEAIVQSWSEYEPDEPYDAIISIGAIEHFALRRSSREARLETYREFFRRCRDMLREGSWLALQSVSKAGGRLDREAVDDFRAIDDVFPDSAIPWPSELLQAAEGIFQLESVVLHGQHYAQTTRAWEQELKRRHDDAVALVGEDVVRRWERYLGASARRFEQGHADLLRLAFQRL
jgi:cyclopropane-fatty-acyl-phospholipid synthase